MKHKILGVVSAILTVAATVVTSTASFWILYQPKTPKSLLK